LKSVLKAVVWLIPYLVSGFSAPLIFKNILNLQAAGHIAGAFFIFAGVWSLFLTFKFQMPSGIKGFFLLVLVLQIIFWSWRFFNNLPLKEASLLGLSGSAWHGLLTSLYLLVAVILLGFEMRYLNK
jgi:hypothetical protein